MIVLDEFAFKVGMPVEGSQLKLLSEIWVVIKKLVELLAIDLVDFDHICVQRFVFLA